MQPYDGNLNYIAENHKDAFLGKSKGILGAYNASKIVDEFKDVL